MPEYNFNPEPPKEALSFFRAKGLKPGFDHRDVWQQEHATAFTVAKAMKMDVLETIRDELDRSLAEGVTFEQFKKDITPTLQKQGWWGESEEVDPVTGEKKAVQLGSNRRLKTIYETNMRQARAAGQWQRAQRTKKRRPYLLYELGPSSEHREQHHAWHGICLHIDDPWWQTHMPMNGWGCKCRVRQVSKREYDRLASQGKISTESPAIETQEWKNKRTGEIEQIPKGIDPGFNMNPGAVARTDHAAQVLGTKLKTTRADIGAAAMQNSTDFIRQGMVNNYQRWASSLYKREVQAVGETQIVATLRPRVINQLRDTGVELDPAAVTLQDKQVRHLARPNKHSRDHALPEQAILDLAKLMETPKAILLDKRDNGLLYIIDTGAGKLGKVVISPGLRNKAHINGKREKIQTNDIRTASQVELGDLQGSIKGNTAELLQGEI